METRPAPDEIDLHALFFKLRTRWPLFVVALLLAGSGAYLYLQVKAPVYGFRATMLMRWACSPRPSLCAAPWPACPTL
jgi:uncharacterized protein involved in exopolysaccharide biosynthesis